MFMRAEEACVPHQEVEKVLQSYPCIVIILSMYYVGVLVTFNNVHFLIFLDEHP